MKTWLQIKFWKIARWLVVRGYGEGCEISDLDECNIDELKHMYGNTMYEIVTSPARCASCRAKEVIQWIDEHIDLIKS
jgi:hypothetical protein